MTQRPMTIAVTAENGTITIEDGQGHIGTVTTADIKQSNGVIHVIDTVLLPEGS
ncbi:MAG: hypothetical protein HC779_03560 [Phyllobacteriaceae bacterium]|nr:hypothetical protein [Phyllobacteriaceae bacterium]